MAGVGCCFWGTDTKVVVVGKVELEVGVSAG